jgi:hypothetical protein
LYPNLILQVTNKPISEKVGRPILAAAAFQGGLS